MPASDEQTQIRHALEMYTVANEYCLFMEKAIEYSTTEIQDYVHKISALLYLKGLVLPFMEPDDTTARERYVTEEQYESLFNDLREKLDTQDEFYFMDYSLPIEENPIKGSLSEFCADIYQDLKDFVLLYSKNSILAKDNAVSYVKQLFENHWGPRLLILQGFLHSKLYQADAEDVYPDY